MRRLSLLTLLIIAIGSAIALWFEQLANEEAVKTTQYSPDEKAYNIKNFTAVIYGNDGNKAQELRGDELSHYPYDGRIHITRPYAETYHSDKQWKISALNAVAINDLNELIWQEEVTLQQAEPDTALIQTPELTQHPRKYTASSQKGVKLSTDQSSMLANEMYLNTETSQLKLSGNVQGNYQTR